VKIVYISAGTGENPWIMDAAFSCRNQGIHVHVIQAQSELLDLEEKRFAEILEEFPSTNLLIVDSHGSATYFKKFDRVLRRAKELNIQTFVKSSLPEEMKEFRDLFPHENKDYDFVHSCLELGGKENTNALILWACKTIGGAEIEIPPLLYPPTEGFYHPSLPDIFDFSSHEKRLDPQKPTVGILLHQYYYIRKNVLPIDALVSSLEAKGMNALPFFLITSPNEVTGAIGIRKFIETYLIKNKKPIIDVLIINMSFSQISLSDPGDGTKTEAIYNFFIDLNVPLLQTITLYRSYDAWAQDDQGLSIMEISSGVIWPEYDGQIITIPLASTETYEGRKNVSIPIPRRGERIADMALRWALLKRTPVHERKIAILLYQYTGKTEALGDAGGLDTPQSVIQILQKLKEAGYTVDHIPKSGNELIEEMLTGLTNDTRWISEKEMRERAVDLVKPQVYHEWFAHIPKKNQQKISEDWGLAPGEVLVSGEELCIPGKINGNIFIGIQPPRGLFEKIESLIHSNDMVMPHQYLAYYRWIKHVFGAHAVIHMGTHGTLEWLPGKGNALSEECYPDIILEDMPHIYPYIMNDPGEGMQAKRRSWAVLIDHLVPAMMRADGYGELMQLDTVLQEYFRAKNSGEAKKADELITQVHSLIQASNLTYDLGLSADADVQVIADNAERIYDYICDVRDVIIKDGLHIFGLPPQGPRLCEMIYALTRLENGTIPSLRECIAKTLDLSLRELTQEPSRFHDHYGMTNGALIDMIDKRCQDLIRTMAEVRFDTHKVISFIQEEYGDTYPELEMCCRFICECVVMRLYQTTDELNNLIRGLEAGYIPPGPCGDPTRGNVHLLPTGKNCYSIDPATIPTPAAWNTGKAMADQMIERYINEKGEYPQKVGIVVWATDTMRTGGDDIAYIFWLMGLRPIWSSRGGTVTGLEIVSANELGRPRIDVTLRISGLFRDSYPHLVQLIDEGVEMIATLDESEDVNYLAAHLKKDMLEQLKEGLSEEEAKQRALIRIFGDPPGNHGCAVGEVVHASSWKDRKDLADVYTTWSAHAYGRRYKGEFVPELFKEQCATVDVTVKNRVSREFDILDVDDDYIFLGGMNACVKTYGDKEPVSVIGEASDPKNVKTRLLDEEIRFIYRSRVLNPRWIEGLKPHGFRGVQEVMNTIEYTFGWDATSDAVDDWEYQAAAEHFLFNDENREWIEENNPYALHSIAGRLLEAYERGFWQAHDETIQRLQEIYLKSEAFFERMEI